MNIYDHTGQSAVGAEIAERRRAKLLAIAAELREVFPARQIGYATASWVMEIEELSGVVDLETGDVFWPQ